MTYWRKLYSSAAKASIWLIHNCRIPITSLQKWVEKTAGWWIEMMAFQPVLRAFASVLRPRSRDLWLIFRALVSSFRDICDSIHSVLTLNTVSWYKMKSQAAGSFRKYQLLETGKRDSAQDSKASRAKKGFVNSGWHPARKRKAPEFLPKNLSVPKSKRGNSSNYKLLVVKSASLAFYSTWSETGPHVQIEHHQIYICNDGRTW